MGAQNDIQQSLLDSIKLMSEKIANNTDAAIVIKGEIVELIDGGKRQYSVAYGGAIYDDAYAASGVSYQPATVVYLLIPNGDFSQKKQIINSVDPSSEQYVNENEINRNIPMSNNLFNYSGQIDLKSWIDSESTESAFVNGNFSELLQNYLALYRRILFSAEIKTEIDLSHQMAGNYGLILTLYFKNQETGEIQPRDFTMDVNTVEGNPYAFTAYQPIELYYDIDDIWEYYVDETHQPSMKSFVSGFGYSQEEINKKQETDTDIHIKNIQFRMVNNLTDENLSGYYLSLVPSNGHYFRDDGEYAVSKTITPKLKVNGKDTDIKDWACYWFIEDGSVNAAGEGYQRFGGIGWRCINKKQNTQIDNDGRATYQYVTTDRTLTVNREDINYTLRYKCVLVKDEVITNSAIIKLTNLSSNAEASLASATGSNIFVEGIGKVRLRATLKYYNPGTNIFTTYWQRFDKNGNYLDDNFYIIDKQENTYSEDDKGQYIKSITEISFDCSLVDKSNLVNCTFYCSSVVGEDEDIKQINLATESINVSTSPELTYTLSILNGDILYKYDADGDSPMIADYDGPVSSIIKNIKPITYAVYKPDGTELTPDEYMQVKYRWYFPVNSMMTIDQSIVTRQDDEDYYIIDNYNKDGSSTPYNLNYNIRNTYNKKKSNNTIILEVEFNGVKLSSSITPQFLKDGESGTNGSKYAAIIEYNGKAYGEIDEYGNAIKMQVVYAASPETSKGWYIYNRATDTLEKFDTARDVFSIEVFKDGEPITTGYNTVWSEFDPTVTNPCVDIENTGTISIREGKVWDDPTDVYCSIVECCVTIANDGHEESVYTYYPIEITRIQKLDAGSLIPRLEGGFESVLYASDGTNPQYDNSNPFIFIDDLYNKDNGKHYYEYTWSSSSNLKEYARSEDPTGASITIRPVTQYLNGDTNNYVKLKLGTSQEIVNNINEKIQTIQADINYQNGLKQFYQNDKKWLIEGSGTSKSLVQLFDYDGIKEGFDKSKNFLTRRLEILTTVEKLKKQLEEIKAFCEKNKISTVVTNNEGGFDYITIYNRCNTKIKNIYRYMYLMGNGSKISTFITNSSTYNMNTAEYNNLHIENKNAFIKKYSAGMASQLTALLTNWNNTVKYEYIPTYNKITSEKNQLITQEEFLTASVKALANLPSSTAMTELTKKQGEYNALEEFINIKTQMQALVDKLNIKYNQDNFIGECVYISYAAYIDKLLNKIKSFLAAYLDTSAVEAQYDKIITEIDNKISELTNEKNNYQKLLLPEITDAIVHIKPIVMTMNRYELANINGWDGSKLYIGGADEGEYLLAPQVGAGQKNSAGQFTGMVMGIRSFSKNASKINQDIGLFGYSDGVQSLFLNSKDGSATFGLSGEGQIQIIPGTSAIIKSGNYNDSSTPSYYEVYNITGNPKLQGLYEKDGNTYKLTQDIEIVSSKQYYKRTTKSGMMIDFTKPEIKFGSGDFEVNNKGEIKSTAGHIGGWHITESALESGESGGNGIIINSNGSIQSRNENWVIANDGKATFKDIDAQHGLIAGWEINGSTISKNNTSLDSSTGTITCSHLIASTDGEIGGWKINGNTLSSSGITLTGGTTGGSISFDGAGNSFSLSSSGFAFSAGGLAITAGSGGLTTLTEAKTKVSTNSGSQNLPNYVGDIVVNNATVLGTLTTKILDIRDGWAHIENLNVTNMLEVKNSEYKDMLITVFTDATQTAVRQVHVLGWSGE